MSIETLRQDVERLWAAGADASREEGRELFGRLRAALSEGTVRAASPDATSPTGWVVNSWVKQGILLGFRFGDLVDVSMDHGRWPFFDKDTLPLQRFGTGSGVRIVPGGSSVRDGALPREGRHRHPADVRQHRRLRGRGLDDRLARAGRIVRADRRPRAPQRRGPDRRRDRAGRRDAGDHRGRGARRRQHRHLRRRRGEGAGGDRRRHDPHRVHAGLRPARTAASSGRRTASRS